MKKVFSKRMYVKAPPTRSKKSWPRKAIIRNELHTPWKNHMLHICLESAKGFKNILYFPLNILGFKTHQITHKHAIIFRLWNVNQIGKNLQMEESE